MSTKKITAPEINLADFFNRLKLLLNILKQQGIKGEHVKGLSRQNLSKSMHQGSLPKAGTLALWAEELDVNLHWLLLNEGPMFRRDLRAENESPTQAERIAALEKDVMHLQKKLLESKARTISLLDDLRQRQRSHPMSEKAEKEAVRENASIF